jgi:hypothetical protein
MGEALPIHPEHENRAELVDYYTMKAVCKLPRQGDTAKGELRASSWARYVVGGRPANASCGRSSL